MMQVQRFSDGGFVLHKVYGQRISAWFSPMGILLDCEKINSRGQSRKPPKSIVERLQRMGPNWI